MTDRAKDFFENLRGRTVSVVGVGVSNAPLISMLVAHKAIVTARDKKVTLGELQPELEKMSVKVILGEDYLEDIEDEIIIKTPGIRSDLPQFKKAAERGSVVTSEMEIFFDLCPCRIIAVTGSDGKSTTTSLISEILKNAGLKVRAGGNLGKPLLPEIFDIMPDDTVVLELSSFQLNTMKKSPNIAVVTNISPNHLDWHIDMQEYIDSKTAIINYQNKNDRAVFNLDNEITANYSKTAKGEVLYFSMKTEVPNGAYYKDGYMIMNKGGREVYRISRSDLSLVGNHNIENFLAAMCAVYGLCDQSFVLSTAKTFKGLAHRIEFVREIKKVKYYNDSIASTPSRTLAGLKCFDSNVLLILGGRDKHLPWDDLVAGSVSRVKAVFATGEAKELIKKEYSRVSDKIEIVDCENLNDAVIKAHSMAVPGDYVIMSPACTSFDAFRNFEERGDYFKSIVMSL